MKIEQIYTGCLAQGAYYIMSEGEVAIIDPLREVDPYIQKANLDKAKIKYVLETHFHADFVSGHIDLAKKQAQKLYSALLLHPLLNFIRQKIMRKFYWVRLKSGYYIRQATPWKALATY